MSTSQTPDISTQAFDYQKFFGRMNIGQALKQHKKLLIGVFLFVWLASSIITLLSYKPTFVSKGMVVIRDTAVTAKYVTGDSYETTTSQATSSVINTMGLLRTNAYMKNLWEYFHTKHPEELEKIHINGDKDWETYFDDGSNLIEYYNFPGTDMIEIQFKWSDPAITREGLEVVLNTFRDLSLKLNRKEQHERGRFLGGQIDDIQKKLVAVRSQIRQYKEEHQILDTVEENANLARARVNLRTDLEAANAEAAGKMQQVSGYQQLLGMSPRKAIAATAVGRNEVLSKMYSELYTIRLERKSLLTRYTETNVKVQEVDSRIKQLEHNIRQELMRTVGAQPSEASGGREPAAVADNTRSEAISNMLSAKTTAMDLSAKARSLQGYLNELNTRARSLNEAEAALAAYKLEEASLDESLRVLKQKKLDAQLKESQTLSNVFIVEEPNTPINPVFPTQKPLLMLDFVLALGLALLAVIVKSLLSKNANNPVQADPQKTEEALINSSLKILNARKPYRRQREERILDHVVVTKNSHAAPKSTFFQEPPKNQAFNFPGLPSNSVSAYASHPRKANAADLSIFSQMRR